jgi:hypothetical protein
MCARLLAAAPPASDTSDLAAYEKARATIGRNADAHVKLALWCEAHGLQAERLKHLALAILIEPAHATARGLMGLVAYRGRWQRPTAVAETVKADAALAADLAEYNARRERTPETAEAQWKLALWCEEKGLAAEAKAHYAVVVRLDPSREAAWKKLGCKKEGGRWVTAEQLAAEKAEADAQQQADRLWRPLLTKWRGWLADKSKHDEAVRLLATVSDRRAVPAVWALFAPGNAGHQTVAVQVLGQIDAPASSRALALLAVFSGSAEVRRKATETLKGSDPREYVALLIALLRDPVKYEVRPVGGPGSPGTLFVQGKPFNIQRLYAPPPVQIPIFPGDTLGYDNYGMLVLDRVRLIARPPTERITADRLLQQIQHDEQVQQVNSFNQMVAAIASSPSSVNPAQLVARLNAQSTLIPPSIGQALTQAIHQVQKTEHSAPSQFGFSLNRASVNDTQIPVGQMMLEAQKAAVSAQLQLENDVAAVEAFNDSTGANNSRVTQVLSAATGQDFGQDRESWKAWWVNQLGYVYTPSQDAPVPTIVESVPLAYLPQPVPVRSVTGPTTVQSFTRVSCFGAGTRVRTLRGSEPIETLRVGDQVLSQNLRTGALGYQPVVVVHHNPPSPTFLIKVAGETIVSSPFHRFWKAGQGWVMARDLKPGETLRLLDQRALVESVETGPVQPVYNLDIAQDHDFFAGASAVLVHDNTLPDFRQSPFDAEPDLVALVPPGK